MFIIVEGPTCSGKSMLIERLTSELGNNINHQHKDRPKELTRRWVLQDYVLGHEDYFPRMSHLLADRWHFGERTYAQVYRPETNVDGFGLLGQAGWRWTEMFLASRGAVIATLTADNQTLINRLHERGDDHVKSVDDLLRISSLYEMARRDSSVVGAIYDGSDPWDDEKYDHFVTSLWAEAKRREDLSEGILKWHEGKGYVGSLAPTALLVGDMRNITEKYGEETRLPFMPVDGNSGEFLLNALPEMFWRGVGIINGGETEDIGLLHETIGEPPIVALGNEAAKYLSAQGIDDYIKLPHPQYVRRFHNKQQTEYGKAIMMAATTGENTWTPQGK